MSLPETATFSEFAAIARVKPGYVTQLRKDDRLILTADGKRVRVAESLERIAATRDPAKLAVSARHAAAREAGAATLPAGSESAAVADTGADVVEFKRDRATSSYQTSRAVRERYAALQAKRDYELSIGKLVDAADVGAAAFQAITQLRVRFEALPDILAPQLVAARDETHARALLADSIEHALAETAREFTNLAKEAA